MYEVLDNDYPSLKTFLCYECGFNYDLTLVEQKSLFQQYQKLFIHTKEKGIDLSLKNYSPTETNIIFHQLKINNGIKQLIRKQNQFFYLIIGSYYISARNFP
jgi:hypothetical protein